MSNTINKAWMDAYHIKAQQQIQAIVNDLQKRYYKSDVYTKLEVNQLTQAIKQFEIRVVATLPTASADTMYKIYFVPASPGATDNIKNEFITIQEGNTYKWEQIGSTAIELPIFIATYGSTTVAQLDAAINAGKIIVINDSDTQYRFSHVAGSAGSRTFYFSSFAYNKTYYVTLNESGNRWSKNNKQFQEVSTSLTSLINDAATILALDSRVTTIEEDVEPLSSAYGFWEWSPVPKLADFTTGYYYIEEEIEGVKGLMIQVTESNGSYNIKPVAMDGTERLLLFKNDDFVEFGDFADYEGLGTTICEYLSALYSTESGTFTWDNTWNMREDYPVDNPTLIARRGESTPEPTPIPVVGDVQVFKDEGCTEYATTAQEVVYCRINNPWVGLDSGWSVGRDEPESKKFSAYSPITEAPDDPYGFILWVDWGSDDSSTPYTPGRVIMSRNLGFDPDYDYGEVAYIFSKP